MAIFKFEESSSIGTVYSVDTATLIVKVAEIEKLRKLQVNHLVAIKSSKAGQHLIGIINRITRKASDEGSLLFANKFAQNRPHCTYTPGR